MAARPSGNRRALGDIGNIVGALSATYLVTKPQQQQKFDTELTLKNHVNNRQAEDDSKNGRNVSSSTKKRNRIPDTDGHERMPVDGMEEEEKHEKKNARKKKLERPESATEIDASMSTETTKPLPDGKGNLHEDVVQEWHEIEMEEAESPVRGIDEADAKNPLAVVEYVEDIYTFYRKSEITSCVPSGYMSNQADINCKMRAILIDWLIEVHHKFELRHETLFLTINIIDRYLSRRGVMRKYLQLVGITSMLLACKYEEICVPQMDDFIYISDRAYTREDILKMEKSMLNTLQFNMSVPTPFVFMKRFLKAAESDNKLEMVSFYLLDLCLVEYQALKFPPSLVSAAAVYTARCMLRRTPTWNKTLRHYSTYPEAQLQECASLIAELHRNASQGKLTAVYRKYSVSKYNCVSILVKTTTIETQSCSN